MSAQRRLVVAGGGAVGSAIALALARAGHAVVLADPAPLGDNASGVAAGMIAPAFEAVLDEASTGHFDLLRAGRDLWSGFLGGIDPTEAGLDRSGALWIDRRADAGGQAEVILAKMAAIGAEAQRVDPQQARALSAGLGSDVAQALFTPEDWRLDPARALGVLRRAALDAGCVQVAASVTGFEVGIATLSDGQTIAADLLVAATGAEAAFLAPELARLSPIKGQIIRFADAGPTGGPSVRARGGYASPSPDGLVAGATMEAGRADRGVDPAAAAGLAAFAARLYPGLAGREPAAAAGVRATSPDGLPLVGASGKPGVLVAAGMRRNGWLLAPLAAGVITALANGDDPGPYAARLDARRFED
ncbi:MAG: FAD-dependent oxidoreductase [Caulobacteraceae bacterium]|nr:FAD-dependent oxidoreductase [Caulobacteraceae bacterium]